MTTLSPSRQFREELLGRGAGDAVRCFQCATCSAACELTTPETVFPRRQMLWVQWGLADRLAADPAVWLCHQCNDCTVRCPRDARPGDAMQAVRALMVERFGAPRFMARLVGRARTTWPLLLGLPVLLWVVYIQAVGGFAAARTPLVYGDVVPVWMIDSVFLPAALFAAVASAVGARRVWAAWGGGAGTRVGPLASVAAEILLHRRFGKCVAGRPRRAGHLLLMWGFLGAAATTTLLAVLMDLFHVRTPLHLDNPVKILGNASAVFLVLGAIWLAARRLGGGEGAGRSRSYDTFLLVLVALVVFTGVGAELARLLLPVPVALAVYVLHLGTILCLFVTFPFSKLAHLVYRTLAMAHERLSSQRRPT